MIVFLLPLFLFLTKIKKKNWIFIMFKSWIDIEVLVRPQDKEQSSDLQSLLQKADVVFYHASMDVGNGPEGPTTGSGATDSQ